MRRIPKRLLRFSKIINQFLGVQIIHQTLMQYLRYSPDSQKQKRNDLERREKKWKITSADLIHMIQEVQKVSQGQILGLLRDPKDLDSVESVSFNNNLWFLNSRKPRKLKSNKFITSSMTILQMAELKWSVLKDLKAIFQQENNPSKFKPMFQ